VKSYGQDYRLDFHRVVHQVAASAKAEALADNAPSVRRVERDGVQPR
jgi:hypothetical protein